ncbi:hypothetical protein, partial [Candidatus Chlorohelix sp.]|uniref:coiled-coil domain-containing protein n=1 Tax=Candidatus Chlorohelix sp. TaxID=3139201 RepID=UPI00306E19D5
MLGNSDENNHDLSNSELIALIKSLKDTVDCQKKELELQKKDFERRINELEKNHSKNSQDKQEQTSDQSTSRRKMLKRLGAAAAGIAVAGAATISQTATPVHAAGAFQFQSDATTGLGTLADPNKSTAPTYWTVVNASSTPGTAVPVLDITNATTTGTLLDGVKVTVASGVALSGSSTSDVAISGTTQGTSKAAVNGLIGSVPTINNNLLSYTGAVTGTSGSSSASTHGVAGFSGSTGAAGVFGASEGGPGVYGVSSTTYGGYFQSVSTSTAHAQLKVQPHTQNSLPSSGTTGEMYVSNAGLFYIYTGGNWNLMSNALPFFFNGTAGTAGTPPNVATGATTIDSSSGAITEPGTASPLLKINNTRGSGSTSSSTLKDGLLVTSTNGIPIRGIAGDSANATLQTMIGNNKGAVAGASTTSYGGQFGTTHSASGQLKIDPHPTVSGAPTWTGALGEIFMDSAGVLWVYSKATPTSTAAAWNLMLGGTASTGLQFTFLQSPDRFVQTNYNGGAGYGNTSTPGVVNGFTPLWAPASLSN